MTESFMASKVEAKMSRQRDQQISRNAFSKEIECLEIQKLSRVQNQERSHIITSCKKTKITM